MTSELSSYYKALSNPVRLQVFEHVVAYSEGKAPKHKEKTCVCEISDTIGVPQPTVSNHLKVLEEAGLITSVKVGTKCYQYVQKDAAKALLESSKIYYKMAHKNPY
ncbi:winged helix-turn-helix transcriptional regulator [Candidatus Saccharibacteria bacterium]|nr:winged helix-turn-helix transcriptional regulator [Candidatus Saccharibacteria bacterium]